MHGDDAAGLVGFRVVSGTGEELGRVTGVVAGPDGRARKLAFVEEDGDEPRFVSLKFVRAIVDGKVRLAGPREGYHITRVRQRSLVRFVPDRDE